MFSANSSQVSDDKLFVEDVFSTYLYTGNSGTQTITNGIDLAGKGGLIWLKSRSSTAGHPIGSHALFDTVRGIGAIDYVLRTNLTDAQNGVATIQSVNSDGFTFGGGNPSSGNQSGETYASWTFREAPKFFDIVTYTGNGATTRDIAHSLGVAPGMVIVKATSTSDYWWCWHRAFAADEAIFLNTTGAKGTYTNSFPSVPTATNFTVGSGGGNANGATYVAYLFAHDATSDGIIQCGTYTGNGNTSVQNINLGWEPQWILIKQSVVAGGAAGYADAWQIVDNMRGLVVGADDAILNPNNANAENTNTFAMVAEPTATGWQVGSQNNYSGATYIYMAIRRGPMRTPTLGTSVFAPALGNSSGAGFTSGFPVDAAFIAARSITEHKFLSSRLTGTGLTDTDQSIAEYTDANNKWDYNTQYYGSALGSSWVSQMFRRAPGFMDVVCYTGTGALLNANHNLGVVPELMLIKSRSVAEGWVVYSAPTGNNKILNLNATTAAYTAATWNNTTPSATTFTLNGGGYFGNISGVTYVAYLFASAPGVSKVGSYTGNGSSQTINCGFAAGARFVMIKRTDSTGDWYVWDTARGIVAANDPHLSLNTTAAEVTTDDSVDTDSSGFVVNQVAATNVNVNAATYIYLAIA